MRAFFSALREGSDFHDAAILDEGFVIRPKTGFQKHFNRLAELVLVNADDRYAVLPQSDGKLGWSSLVIIPLD